MSMKDWERRPNGDIRVGPLLAWDIAALAMTGFLRLRYADQPDQVTTGGIAVQLAMTAAQARLLGEDLLRTADTLDADNQPHGTQQ
jgi:hypothetical protein